MAIIFALRPALSSWAQDYGLRTTDYGLRTTDFGSMAPSPLLPHLGMTNIFNYNKGMPVIIYYADRMASRLRLEETTPHFLAISRRTRIVELCTGKNK